MEEDDFQEGILEVSSCRIDLEETDRYCEPFVCHPEIVEGSRGFTWITMTFECEPSPA